MCVVYLHIFIEPPWNIQHHARTGYMTVSQADLGLAHMKACLEE